MGEYADLKHIMNPRSVAIIGASQNPEKVGHVILQNYFDVGYSGKLFPVNNSYEGRILGLPVYKSVLDIKSGVDLAVIAIPAEHVAEVLTECGKAHVKGVVIVSSGFSEVGETERQEKITEISKKYGMPVIGPNCLGVMDMRSRIDTMYLPTFKLDKPKIGSVSFASQSGAVGSLILDVISHEGFGLSKFISYGNAAVVDETDILNYLAYDKDTKIIVFYIEGAKRGKEFIDVAKKATKIKPVIIIKGGKTSAGASAAHSHTAALAGSAEAYDAVFKQFGFVEAEDMDELIAYAKIFDTQPLTTGNRIGMITNGGGMGVLATDAIYKNGLVMAELSEESKKVLKESMPPIVNIRLPLDIGGDADDKRFAAALDTVSSDPNVDALIVITLFQTPGADSRVASMLIHRSMESKKPIVVISPGGSYTQVHKDMMESSGVPVYDSEDLAAKSLKALIDYSKYKNRMI